MVERVIEEQAAGDPKIAKAIRSRVGAVIEIAGSISKQVQRKPQR